MTLAQVGGEPEKQCPTCGKWDVYKAYVEDGGFGDWCPHCNKSTEGRKKFNPLIGIAGILLLVVIYGVGNLVLYYAQEAYRKPDIERCELLNSELIKMEGEIGKYKLEININKEKMIAQKEIEILEQKLRSPDNYYNTQITYERDFFKYKQFIKNYNKNVEDTNRLIKGHKELINNYNSKVEVYNQIAPKAYTRWYIIPVPGKVSKAK